MLDRHELKLNLQNGALCRLLMQDIIEISCAVWVLEYMKGHDITITHYIYALVQTMQRM
jgi:hypothetical protein